MTIQAIPMPTGNKYHPLRILREQLCMTRADLAAKAKVSLRTLHGVENSEYPPRLKTRARILEALGIPLDQHLEIFGPVPRGDR